MTRSVPWRRELPLYRRIRQWVRDYRGGVLVERSHFTVVGTGEPGGIVERWTTNRLLDRVVDYRPDGTIHREMFFGDNRDPGGPAEIRYGTDGSPDRIRYTRGTGHHRLDGPAIIGNPPGAGWYYLGEQVRGPADVGDALAAEPPEKRLDLLRASSYFALLDEGITEDVIVRSLRAGVYAPAGIREVAGGAPAEWVAAYESGDER